MTLCTLQIMRLQNIMSAHNLRPVDVVRLLDVSRHTVTAWLKPQTSTSHRVVPPQMLDLLMYRLSDKRYKVPD